jgi:hypothetical protein
MQRQKGRVLSCVRGLVRLEGVIKPAQKVSLAPTGCCDERKLGVEDVGICG